MSMKKTGNGGNVHSSLIKDFDADHMERMLKQTMRTIPKRDVPARDDALGYIPDHSGVTYALSTDPEASSTMV